MRAEAADQGMPGTWARGEKHPSEDPDGLLEPGRAREKDEVTGKRAKNTPPLGKTRHFILGEGKQILKGERRRCCWRGWGDRSTYGGRRWKSAGGARKKEESPCKAALGACEKQMMCREHLQVSLFLLDSLSCSLRLPLRSPFL